MECKIKDKEATFGSEVFCKTCGMDIWFDPVKVKHKGRLGLYCCEECAK